jgi:hypothetical protein
LECGQVGAYSASGSCNAVEQDPPAVTWPLWQHYEGLFDPTIGESVLDFGSIDSKLLNFGYLVGVEISRSFCKVSSARGPARGLHVIGWQPPSRSCCILASHGYFYLHLHLVAWPSEHAWPSCRILLAPHGHFYLHFHLVAWPTEHAWEWPKAGASHGDTVTCPSAEPHAVAVLVQPAEENSSNFGFKHI